MANSAFTFKQFKIEQSDCAMKVGTDGVLLGAWARGGERILDVGTGSGLIAMLKEVFLVIEFLLCTLRCKTIVRQIKQSWKALLMQ